MASSVVSCRWDWCRSSFSGIDALDAHVKHEHIWPMKPMRKAEIALMRRMDRQSLHSSRNTESSIISRGLMSGVSRSKTPPLALSPPSTPQTHKRQENEEFNTFTHLSFPPQTYSPQSLLASPAVEHLMRENEMFEQTHVLKANQRPAPRCSPTHRTLSQSSCSSQEVVEQQLTQEDDVYSPPPLPSGLPIEHGPTGNEPRQRTDDDSNALATEEIRNSEQPVSKQEYLLRSSPDPASGQVFRYGSLDVPLGLNTPIGSQAPQAYRSPSHPFVLQTQAPYSSQATSWSQTQ